MSTFTVRELEFLAGLNKSWWTLYCRELARLQRHEDSLSNVQQEVQAAIHQPAGIVHRPAAKILTLVQNQGRFADAQQMFKRSMAIRAKTGPV